MKSTDNGLGRWEKIKCGNIWDWIKKKTNRHIFYISGYRIVKVNTTAITIRGSVVS